MGTGLANVSTQIIVFILLQVYSWQQEELKEAMIWPDARIFLGLKEYISLAVPTTIMICLDWWVWELMILMCGYFPEETRV
jgi:multidrug resistance protein, MATE family